MYSDTPAISYSFSAIKGANPLPVPLFRWFLCCFASPVPVFLHRLEIRTRSSFQEIRSGRSHSPPKKGTPSTYRCDPLARRMYSRRIEAHWNEQAQGRGLCSFSLDLIGRPLETAASYARHEKRNPRLVVCMNHTVVRDRSDSCFDDREYMQMIFSKLVQDKCYQSVNIGYSSDFQDHGCI